MTKSDNGNGKDERIIEPCPRCGINCRVSSRPTGCPKITWLFSVSCGACCYRWTEHSDELTAIAAHNELCKKVFEYDKAVRLLRGWRVIGLSVQEQINRTFETDAFLARIDKKIGG